MIWNILEEYKCSMDNSTVGSTYPEGTKDKGIKLVSNHGSQPTSRSFMKFCSELGIKQIFALIIILKEMLKLK